MPKLQKLEYFNSGIRKRQPSLTRVEDLTESFNAKIEAARKKLNVPTLSDADVLHLGKLKNKLPKFRHNQENIKILKSED